MMVSEEDFLVPWIWLPSSSMTQIRSSVRVLFLVLAGVMYRRPSCLMDRFPLIGVDQLGGLHSLCDADDFSNDIIINGAAHFAYLQFPFLLSMVFNVSRAFFHLPVGSGRGRKVLLINECWAVRRTDASSGSSPVA